MPIKIYLCEHCKCSIGDFSETVLHEKKCEDNPENRGCGTCENFDYNFDADAGFCAIGKDGNKFPIIHCAFWKLHKKLMKVSFIGS